MMNDGENDCKSVMNASYSELSHHCCKGIQTNPSVSANQDEIATSASIQSSPQDRVSSSSNHYSLSSCNNDVLPPMTGSPLREKQFLKNASSPSPSLSSSPSQNSLFSSPSITVPHKWKRVLQENKIVYISPSKCHLSSIQEVIAYLQADGTCKCGLNCPLVVTSVFNFDPALPSEYPTASLGQCLTTSSVHCCFSKPSSPSPVPSAPSPKEKKPLSLPPLPPSKSPSPKKENILFIKKKRSKLKNRSPFDGVLVSQLLAQRDKFGLKKKEEQLSSMASEVQPDSKLPFFHTSIAQQLPMQSQSHLVDQQQQPVMVSYLEPLPSSQEINVIPRYQQIGANPSEIKAFQNSDGSYGLYASNLKTQQQIPILSHPIIQNVNIITGNTSYNCVTGNQPFSNTHAAPPSLFTQQVQINPNCLSDSQLSAENMKFQHTGGKLAFITSKDLQCHNVDMRNLPVDNNITLMNPNNLIASSPINYAISSGAQVPVQANCITSVPQSLAPSNSVNSLSSSNQTMPCNRLVVDPNVVNVVIGKPHEKHSHFPSSTSLKGQVDACSSPKTLAFESMQGTSLPFSNIQNLPAHSSSTFQNLTNSSSPKVITLEAFSSSHHKHEASPLIIQNQAASNSLSPSNNIYNNLAPHTLNDIHLQNNLNPALLADKSNESPLQQPIKLSLSNHTLQSCSKSPSLISSSVSTPPANVFTSLEANSLCNLQHPTFVMVSDGYNSKQTASSSITKNHNQPHVMEPQHVILTQNQVPSQGMITMLPTENAPQMGISEDLKPTSLNASPSQVLPNGSCLIMGSSPSFGAKSQHALVQDSMVSSQEFTNASSLEALIASKSLEMQRTQGDIIFIERNRVAENSIASQIILNKICQAEKDGKIIVPEPLLNQIKEIESGNQTSNSLSPIKNSTVPSLFSLPPTSVVSTCSFVNDSNKKVHCQVVNNPSSGMISLESKQQCAMNSPMPPLSIPTVTSVTTSLTQVIPAVGLAPSMLSQSVQPVVQVINTIPLNAMQNTLLISGGQPANLQQNAPLDPSNLLGASNVINNVILPPTSLSFVPTNQTTTIAGINCHQTHLVPTIDEKMMECRPENFEIACSSASSGTPTISLPSSSAQVPFSMDNHSNLPINSSNCGTFVGNSKKRSRDSKRKMNQTVASILQLSNQVSPVVVQGIQQPQQIINQPMLQTVTVLPSLQESQPRPLFQQQIVNYGNNLTTPLGANTTQFLGTPLGVMQPLNMINMPQSGTTIFQNIPIQHMMPGSSLTLIHESQGLNQLASQDQHPVVINNAASAPFTLQAAQVPNAFNNGSLVPNFMTTNPLISSPMVKTEIISNPSLSIVPNQNHLAPRPPAHSNLGPSGHIMQPIISLSQETWHVPKIENIMTYTQSQVKDIPQKDLSISPSEGRTNMFEARSIGVQSIDCEDQVVYQNVESNQKPSNIGKVTSSLVVSSTQQQPDSQSFCSPSEGEYLWPDPGNLSAAVRAVIHSDKIYKDNPPPSCLEKYPRGYIATSNNLLFEKPSSVEKPSDASSSGTAMCQGSMESYGLCDTTTSEIWPQQQVMKCDTTVGEPSDSPDPALEPMDLVHSSNGANVVRTERKKGFKRHRWDTLINDESLVQEEVRS